MTTGTISILVGVVLLILLEVCFKKDLDEDDKNYSASDDNVFKGADGVSGVLGLNSEDIGPFRRNNDNK